jgi:metallo-beta-lactamase family protein
VFNVTSYGGAGEVTGSCHLVQVGEATILLDCGMHQGGDIVTRMRKEHFDFDPARIDAVVLSHAHLDHSGLLPLLIHRGFRGPIYCTRPTRNLLAIMLDDALGLYERDLEYYNLRKRRAGRKPLTAVYGQRDVVAALDACDPSDYHEQRSIAEGVQLRFLDAGHILGSAVVELEYGDKTLVFSGDLGKNESVLMRDPEIPERADLVLLESTYGNRDHRSLDDTIAQLVDILEQASREGGNILLPAFAVGRTQELLFHLGCLFHKGQLKNWHVFLDSPMAIEVTRLYSEWLDAMDAKDQRALAHFGARSLEQFLPGLTLANSVDESMAINRMTGGAIIIAGSGMCNGGRIRHHLKHRLWHSNTHLVFTGYQAVGTLGRQLVDGAEQVKLFGRQFAVRAKVHTLGGFSAHAGQRQLVDWATAIGGKPRFRLVHGETESLEALRQTLKKAGCKATVMKLQDTVEV